MFVTIALVVWFALRAPVTPQPSIDIARTGPGRGEVAPGEVPPELLPPTSLTQAEPLPPRPRRERAPAKPAVAVAPPPVIEAPPPPPPAPAPPSVDTAAVQEALEAGAKSEQEQDWDRALEHYQRARQLDPSLGVIVDAAVTRVRTRRAADSAEAYRRARQYDALGRVADAITWYERAIRGLPEGDSNRALAVQRLAVLKSRK